MKRLWPKSLAGQMFLTMAAALFIAQMINAAIIYRGQHSAIEAQIASTAAVRLIAAAERLDDDRGIARDPRGENGPPQLRGQDWRGRRSTRLTEASPLRDHMTRLQGLETRLSGVLDGYDVPHKTVVIAILPFDPAAMQGRERRKAIAGVRRGEQLDGMVLAAIERPDGRWLSTHIALPVRTGRLVGLLAIQTLILYIALLIPTIWLTRRLSHSLVGLRTGVSQFRHTQEPVVIPERGPSDIAELIAAFNAMSKRIAAMLNEKDVMLGAIGHDLKTPLAALRVRVESIDDDAIRARMVAGIDDITRTLDDILSLARIGRPDGDPEPVNIGALVETIADEFRDLGHDVELGDPPRIIAPIRLTWIRRAVRNLIGNAVRYGKVARITVTREAACCVIRIEDDGPGIPEDQIEAMFEPFARLEASRNLATGGAGIGLTLVRAIADQHHGSVTLQNRHDPNGAIEGLIATLRLPLA